MKKIALVHDFLYTYGGAERVLSAFHRLYPEAPIYTMLAEPEIVRKHFPNATIITSSLQRSPLRRKPQLLLATMPRTIEEFDFSGFDTVLSSSGAFSHGVITGPDTRHVCYCHSPMRYVWDWHAEYLREKGVTTPLRRWFAETVLSNIRVWDAVAAKRPDVWMANSATVQKRIKKFYGVESTVIYPPIDTDFFTPQEVKQGNYAVTASRLSAYKKIDEMIVACTKFGLPLRVIGDGEDRKRLEKMGSPNVQFLGRLSEEDKRREIARAKLFLFAAEDDFGIAPLEALSLGVPVVALARGGALEYVQDGKNGRLFEPGGLGKALADFNISMDAAQIRETALPFGMARFDEQIRNIVDNG